MKKATREALGKALEDNASNNRLIVLSADLKKPTQDTTKDKFSFVPKLNVKETWSDKKIFDYFDLSKEEIEFINSHIKEMI